MNAPEHPADRLLEHAAFVRRLALHLAGPSEGDDLAQDTLLAAVAKPLRHEGNLRSWLATITSNLWRNQHRSNARRLRRERAMPGGDPSPSVVDIAAREEVRRRVVAAVLDLPDPLRQIVLLRYYEGLDSSAIALRLQLAASTVRTHLQSAMVRLRERLDHEHGGKRAAWTSPLAQWLPVPGAVPPVVAATVWLRIAAITAIAAAAMLWIVWPQDVASPPPGTTSVASAPAASTPISTSALQPDPAREAAPTETGVVDAASIASWTRPTGTLRGIVRHADSNEPLGDLAVTVRAAVVDTTLLAAPIEPPAIARHGTTSADGIFEFEGLPVGIYEVEALGENGLFAFGIVSLGTRLQQVELRAHEKPRRGLVQVKVIDPSGRAMAKAHVQLVLDSARAGLFGWDRRPPLEGITDARGEFTVRDRPELDEIREGGAVARDGSGWVGATWLGRDDWWKPFSIMVTMHPPGSIVGRLSGITDFVDVEVIGHLSSSMVHGTSVFTFPATVAADGSFRIDGLPPGTYRVQVTGAAGRVDGDQFWNRGHTIVAPGQLTTCEPATIPCRGGSLVRGVVRDANQQPLAGAEIVARLPTMNGQPDRILHHADRTNTYLYVTRRTQTDTAGRYSLWLQPGSWNLVVTMPGHALDVRLAMSVGAEPTIELAHALVADGAIAGFAARSFVLRDVARPGVAHCVGHGGAFELHGLSPGPWEIGEETNGAFRRFTTVQIVVGRTYWIDLTKGEEHVHRGTLLCGGEPVANYDVSIGERGVPVRTSPDGSFELRHCHDPLDPEETLRVGYGGFRIASMKQTDGVIQLPWQRLHLVATTTGGAPIAARVEIGDTFDGTYEKYRTYSPVGRFDLRDGLAQDLLLPSRMLQGRKPLSAVATFPDGSRARVRLTAESRVVPLVHRPTGSIGVRVIDPDGTPCAGCRVWALAWGRDGPAPDDPVAFQTSCADAKEIAEGTSDDQGRAVVLGVAPGPALVTLWRAGAADGTTTSPSRIVHVRAEQPTSVDIVWTR